MAPKMMSGSQSDQDAQPVAELRGRLLLHRYLVIANIAVVEQLQYAVVVTLIGDHLTFSGVRCNLIPTDHQLVRCDAAGDILLLNLPQDIRNVPIVRLGVPLEQAEGIAMTATRMIR